MVVDHGQVAPTKSTDVDSGEGGWGEEEEEEEGGLEMEVREHGNEKANFLSFSNYLKVTIFCV